MEISSMLMGGGCCSAYLPPEVLSLEDCTALSTIYTQFILTCVQFL